MNDDRGIGAMPKLFGAPAYARPKVEAVPGTGRPFDPDDLPIEAHRKDEDESADQPRPEVQATPFASASSVEASEVAPPKTDGKRRSIIRARPLRLKRPGKSS